MRCGSCQLDVTRDDKKRLCYVCGMVVHVACSLDTGCERCLGRALALPSTWRETKAYHPVSERGETQLLTIPHGSSGRFVSAEFPVVLKPKETELLLSQNP